MEAFLKNSQEDFAEGPTEMFYIKTTVLKNLAIFSGKQNVENVALLLFCSDRNGLSLTVNKE